MQRGTLPREFVEEHRRRRVAATVAQLAHDHGLTGVTAVATCRQTKMARATYYGLFQSTSDCLRYAFAFAYAHLFDPVEEVSRSAGSWLGGVDGALVALLDAVATEPLLAELCLVHSLGASEEAAGHDQQAAVETMIKVLTRGWEGPAVSPLLEEYVARAIVSLATLRITEGKAASLPEHRRELVMLAATAFCGVDEAARLCAELGADS